MADKPISGLPALPGNLTLDTLLAVVQGGITYHTEAQQIANFTLGNIKVVQNSNGVSFRFPQSRLQVCWKSQHTLVYGGDGRSLGGEWDFPQGFAATPIVPAPSLPASSGWYSGGATLGLLGSPFFVINTTSSTNRANVLIWDNTSPFASGMTIDVSLLAIGRY